MFGRIKLELLQTVHGKSLMANFPIDLGDMFHTFQRLSFQIYASILKQKLFSFRTAYCCFAVNMNLKVSIMLLMRAKVMIRQLQATAYGRNQSPVVEVKNTTLTTFAQL